MEYTLAIVSRTPTTVLSLNDAKRELDVTFTDDDALIQQHVDTAIDWVENYTNLFLQPVIAARSAQFCPSIMTSRWALNSMPSGRASRTCFPLIG
jgi:hypothetical protein